MRQVVGERIGAGGSAEVFAYGPGAVVKLFRPEYGYAAEMEATRTRAVHETGIAAPSVIDVIDVDDRRGIVLERIDGRTLLEDLIAGRIAARSAGAVTADAQVAIHDSSADLPRLSDVADLGGLPDGTAVAHLDLHPGNVMVSARGPIVIDWVNAHLASVAADVARSVMTIRYESLGVRRAAGGLNEERRVRASVLDGYLDRLGALGAIPDGLDQWLGRAAARLLRAEPDNPDAAELRQLVATAT